VTAATAADPQRAFDLRAAARRLVTRPLFTAEDDPEVFGLVRRHEQTLDRWFTQRFGYRLQVTADTARLYKSTAVTDRRPLRAATAGQRPFTMREYTMLALALAAVAAGPSVISLRDLLAEVRSAATDAGVTVTDEPADRRALVTALRWMVGHGLLTEMHDRLDRYAGDAEADAVLRIRPDRVALLPLPSLGRAETPEELADRPERATATRQWMRARLLEEPVLYRSDLSDAEWGELRRRLGEESDIFEEMFGAHIEARAEGVAVIDPGDGMTDSRFPTGGTVGHAALLLLDRLVEADHVSMTWDAFVDEVRALTAARRPYWSQLADDPERLAGEILDLLEGHRLAEVDAGGVRLLAAAWRYRADIDVETGEDDDGIEQVSLL
jgi:uncharacterized protein (TIGR02678 family)